MEVLDNGNENPNQALTPYYTGDKMIYVPVVEWYALQSHPELLLGRLATYLTDETIDTPKDNTL